MAFESTASGEFFLLGRVLFGAILAFMGLNHFLDGETMVGYAEMKGVPAAGIAVPASGAMLVLGGLGVAVGAFPVLAAGTIAVFLVVATPTMHDFWNAAEDHRQNELINFLKNAGLLGAALAFVAIGAESWPYAANVGPF